MIVSGADYQQESKQGVLIAELNPTLSSLIWLPDWNPCLLWLSILFREAII